MNALERGHELMNSRGVDIPLVAHRYSRALCMRVGMCAEVMLTAFCWYAEREECLPPSGDELYDINPDDRFTAEVIEDARSTDWTPPWWSKADEGSTSNG